jgi:hypothetical protein
MPKGPHHVRYGPFCVGVLVGPAVCARRNGAPLCGESVFAEVCLAYGFVVEEVLPGS